MVDRTLCVICARGGSVGVPGKNIKEIGGKPLIGWAVEKALLSECFSEVIVSTDSREIADVAQQHGAKVPFLRPNEHSTSEAGKFGVWKHALTECEQHFSCHFDYFVDIDCTSPLIRLATVRDFMTKFEEVKAIEDINGVITMTPSHRSPYFNLVEKDKSGKISLSKTAGAFSIERRQDSKSTWDIVAGLYAFKADFIRSKEYLFDGNLLGYEVDRAESFDIDEPLDLEIVESLFVTRSKHILA